jgi:hypothetical protein
MDLQHITDNNGKATGVFILVKSWNEFKAKYKFSDDMFAFYLSLGQAQTLNQRIERYFTNPIETPCLAGCQAPAGKQNMSYAVRLTAQAYEDLTKRITWYDGQQNLGAQFLNAVNQTFSFIAKQPQAYAIKQRVSTSCRSSCSNQKISLCSALFPRWKATRFSSTCRVAYIARSSQVGRKALKK